MPKINDNGVIREMTAEEIAEMELMMADAPKSEPEPSPDERMTQIEAALIELAAMMAGGV